MDDIFYNSCVTNNINLIKILLPSINYETFHKSFVYCISAGNINIINLMLNECNIVNTIDKDIIYEYMLKSIEYKYTSIFLSLFKKFKKSIDDRIYYNIIILCFKEGFIIYIKHIFDYLYKYNGYLKDKYIILDNVISYLYENKLYESFIFILKEYNEYMNIKVLEDILYKEAKYHSSELFKKILMSTDLKNDVITNALLIAIKYNNNYFINNVIFNNEFDRNKVLIESIIYKNICTSMEILNNNYTNIDYDDAFYTAFINDNIVIINELLNKNCLSNRIIQHTAEMCCHKNNFNMFTFLLNRYNFIDIERCKKIAYDNNNLDICNYLY